MDRREFLAKGTVTVGTLTGLAGCFGLFGGNSPPPPRESHVFQPVQMRNGQVRVELENDLWVRSRADVGARLEPAAAGFVDDPGDLSPVGVASAKKGAKGRGTGGYGRAPRDRHGRAILYGHDDDDDWYENNEDEIRRYGAVVTAMGVAYLGSDAQFENNPPGPGRPPGGWDRTVSDPSGAIAEPVDSEGWYRVGAELQAANGSHVFGWEAIDMEVDREAGGMQLDEQWKVSPRI